MVKYFELKLKQIIYFLKFVVKKIDIFKFNFQKFISYAYDCLHIIDIKHKFNLYLILLLYFNIIEVK